jgi:hypothetical protein
MYTLAALDADLLVYEHALAGWIKQHRGALESDQTAAAAIAFIGDGR